MAVTDSWKYKLKVGDEVKLVKSNNGKSAYDGQIVTVTKQYEPNYAGLGFRYYSVTASDGHAFNIYNSGPADDFVFVDFQTRKQAAIDRKKELLEELKAVEKEIWMYYYYDSEEDYVADQILKIVAAGNSKDEVSARKAVIEAIKNMKSSGLI